MGLNVNELQSSLLTLFQSMTDGDDAVFANGTGNITGAYAESGSIATTDAGTIPAGVFSGAGSGSVTVTASVCAAIVKAACAAMRTMASGGNPYLAERLAAAIETMLNGGVVEAAVSGTAVTPSGVTVPVGGTARGTLTGTTRAAMQAAFLSTFTAMDGMTAGGDAYLAQQMASAITAYYKTAKAATAGLAALSGSAGSGSMS